MNKLWVVFFSLHSIVLAALVLPLPNSALHYNTVYFQEEMVEKTNLFELQLSTDSLFSTMIKTGGAYSSKLPVFTISGLQWGKTYYWRINAKPASGFLTKKGITRTFRIIKISSKTFDEVKLKILTNKKEKRHNDYLAIDNTHTIFDREGNPVWTMPVIKGVAEDVMQVRDMKLTADNTLTFIGYKNIFEIDFEGRLLWKGPDPFVYNGDTIGFHHEFLKDESGNYYALGNKYVYRRLTVKLPDDVVKNEADVLITDTGVFRKTEVSQAIKFDRNRRVLWFWDSNTYLTDSDLNKKRSLSGFPNFNTHANSLAINKHGTAAYIGFRDISRIIKVDIKSGKVLASYGEKYPSGEARFANKLFRAQHAAQVTGKNSILILNNNGARGEGTSSVIEFNEVKNENDSLVIWKFNLDFDSLTSGKSIKGGIVSELPNGNLLVCAGELNRVFEVTRGKEIVWDAFIYSRSAADTTWQSMAQYRMSHLKIIPSYHFFAHSGLLIKTVEGYKVPVSITNTGNLADNYKVEIINGENKLLKIKKTGVIKPGAKQNLQILLTSLEIDKEKEIRLRIQALSGLAPEINVPLNVN